MRKFVSAIPFIVAALIAGAAAFGFAIAHEAHKAECNETAMNASKADIQAMDDGEAKTKAMKEMQMGRGDDGQEGHEGLRKPPAQRNGGHRRVTA
jgi:hypothetical protein